MMRRTNVMLGVGSDDVDYVWEGDEEHKDEDDERYNRMALWTGVSGLGLWL